ncbi:hypothetical protein OAH21_00950, partial [bacterium]|nr:hypothetical protein [bacterium]
LRIVAIKSEVKGRIPWILTFRQEKTRQRKNNHDENCLISWPRGRMAFSLPVFLHVFPRDS